jgi:hypothetical protein
MRRTNSNFNSNFGKKNGNQSKTSNTSPSRIINHTISGKEKQIELNTSLQNKNRNGTSGSSRNMNKANLHHSQKNTIKNNPL